MKTIRQILLANKDNRAGIVEFANRCANRALGYAYAAYAATSAAAAAATSAATAYAAAAATAYAADAAADAAASYDAERELQRADLVAIFGEN